MLPIIITFPFTSPSGSAPYNGFSANNLPYKSAFKFNGTISDVRVSSEVKIEDDGESVNVG